MGNNRHKRKLIVEILITTIGLKDEFIFVVKCFHIIAFNLNGFIKIKIEWKFFEMAYPGYIEKWLNNLITANSRKSFLSENPPLMVKYWFNMPSIVTGNHHSEDQNQGKHEVLFVLFTNIKPTPDTTDIWRWGRTDEPIQICVNILENIN